MVAGCNKKFSAVQCSAVITQQTTTYCQKCDSLSFNFSYQSINYHIYLHRKTPTIISQTLNQFNESDHRRFEAFRRCTFSKDEISNFIAACLMHSHEIASQSRISHLNLIGSGNSNYNHNYNNSINNDGGDDTNSMLIPNLSDLVAPGSASKITSLVITLAKIYAQRLVQSARHFATTSEGYQVNKQILPRHLMEAYRGRQHKFGNGFFMQGGGGDKMPSSSSGVIDKNQMKYQFQSASKAQDVCDQIFMEHSKKIDLSAVNSNVVEQEVQEMCDNEQEHNVSKMDEKEQSENDKIDTKVENNGSKVVDIKEDTKMDEKEDIDDIKTDAKDDSDDVTMDAKEESDDAKADTKEASDKIVEVDEIGAPSLEP
jgi:hypothetical protein